MDYQKLLNISDAWLKYPILLNGKGLPQDESTISLFNIPLLSNF